MLDNNDVQAALVADLQANATITALSTGTFPTEIREENWQGEKFAYPNIRVACEVTPAGQCGPDECFTRIICNSEQKSSKEAQNIAGTIAKYYHNLDFTQSSIRFSAVKVQRIMRAVQENGIWSSTVNILMKVK